MKGEFHKIYEDLRTYPEKFFNYCRMNIRTFDELLYLIAPSITYRNTHLRQSISCEERLLVTLR